MRRDLRPAFTLFMIVAGLGALPSHAQVEPIAPPVAPPVHFTPPGEMTPHLPSPHSPSDIAPPFGFERRTDTPKSFQKRAAHTVICNEYYIDGFMSQVEVGHKLLGDSLPETDPKHLKVYLTTDGQKFYLQSNYLPQGLRGQSKAWATKLATNESTDLRQLVFSLLRNDVDSAGFLRQYTTIPILIDQALVKSPLFKTLMLHDAANLSLVADGAVVGELKPIQQEDSSQHWLAQLDDHILAPAEVDQIGNLKTKFEQVSLSKAKILLSPFVLDKATNDTLREKVPASNLVSLDPGAPATWASLLSKHKGAKLFVLGHVEGDSFVLRDAADAKVGNISINQIEQIAKTCCDIEVFTLGCNSAAISATTMGVNQEFNTVDVIHRFKNALDNSSDYWTFFSLLAQDDGVPLEIVISSILLDDDGDVRSGQAEVYRAGQATVSGQRGPFVQVGSIRFTGISSTPPPPPDRSVSLGCFAFVIVALIALISLVFKG